MYIAWKRILLAAGVIASAGLATPALAKHSNHHVRDARETRCRGPACLVLQVEGDRLFAAIDADVPEELVREAAASVLAGRTSPATSPTLAAVTAGRS